MSNEPGSWTESVTPNRVQEAGVVNDSSDSSAQTRHGPRQPQITPGLSRKVTASSGLRGIATACTDTGTQQWWWHGL